MKIKDYINIEQAARKSGGEVARIGAAIIFVGLVMIFTGTNFGHLEQACLLVAAAVIGAYMAMNIGANDVANNVGPAVGSLALSLTAAILIAAIFEAAGAIIAGGEVVKTVKNGIIDPTTVKLQLIGIRFVIFKAALGVRDLLRSFTVAARCGVLRSPRSSRPCRGRFPDRSRRFLATFRGCAGWNPRRAKSGIVVLDDKETFIQVHVPSPRLVIIGAVHISQALVPMAKSCAFDITVIDPRTAFASKERFPGIDLLAEWPQEVLEERPARARSGRPVQGSRVHLTPPRS